MPPEDQDRPSPAIAHISARSRRRAMDWSLVLASQGIETAIENHPEHGWRLVVPEADMTKARETIEQYRRENLRWSWRRQVSESGLLFDWAGALWVIINSVFFWFNGTSADLRPAGAMDVAALKQGEWWRLFTAEWLHADFLHLASNSVFGLLLLGLALGRYGTGVGLLAAYLAGTAGNVASFMLHQESHRSLGASGVVMGALGLLAVQSLALLRQNPRVIRLALGGLAGGGMLFLLLGLNPGSDVAAHFSGFVAGILFGAVLASIPRLAHHHRLNLAAGLLFAALVVWTWGLALRHGATDSFWH